MSRARLSDPMVIRNILLLRDPYVFLVMGSAIVVAAVGLRMLHWVGSRSFITGERITWTGQRPQGRHVIHVIRALWTGWSIAGTCPGPLAAMLGEGKVAGLAVGAGLLVGVTIPLALARLGAKGRARVDLSASVERL